MRRKKSLIRSRIKEVGAMMMVGDGVLALLEPRRHVDLWVEGPKLWRKTMMPFVKRPGITRILGAMELGMGVWVATRQRP
jgi:hypothetical protein